MKNFTDKQLNTLMDALNDRARSQRELAEKIEAGDAPDLANLGIDLAASLREGEREAESLRADFAGEYHRRGRTSCELAHGTRPCPNA